MISRSLVRPKKAGDGTPGYLIHARDMPLEMFDEIDSFWNCGVSYFEDEFPYSPSEYYIDIPGVGQDGGGVYKGNVERKAGVVAWVSARHLEQFLEPSENELGEIHP